MKIIKSIPAFLKVILAFIIIGIIAFGSFAIYSSFNNAQQNNDEKVKDENALYVGAWRVTDSNYNRIHITIINDNKVVYSHSVRTDDRKQLFEIDKKEYEGIVFFDLTDEMLKYSDLGIYYWKKQAPAKNRIIIQIEYIPLSYLSAVVEINDCGIWAINTPTNQGETVEVKHAFIYIQKNYVWGI